MTLPTARWTVDDQVWPAEPRFGAGRAQNVPGSVVAVRDMTVDGEHEQHALVRWPDSFECWYVSTSLTGNEGTNQ